MNFDQAVLGAQEKTLNELQAVLHNICPENQMASGIATLERTTQSCDTALRAVDKIKSFLMTYYDGEVPSYILKLSKMLEATSIVLHQHAITPASFNDAKKELELTMQQLNQQHGKQNQSVAFSISQSFYIDIIDKLLIIEDRYQAAQRSGINNSQLALEKTLKLKNSCEEFKRQELNTKTTYEEKVDEMLEHYITKFSLGKEYENTGETLSDESQSTLDENTINGYNTLNKSNDEFANASLQMIGNLDTSIAIDMDNVYRCLSTITQYLDDNFFSTQSIHLDGAEVDYMANVLANHGIQLATDAQHSATKMQSATDEIVAMIAQTKQHINLNASATAALYQYQASFTTTQITDKISRLRALSPNMSPELSSIFASALASLNETIIATTHHLTTDTVATPDMEQLRITQNLNEDLMLLRTEIQSYRELDKQ
ncbi:MAG: hypothetical protein IJY90_01640 [Clostridia bacterium]|nr:hypothetical protein [Clostridia bacterium]